MLTSKYYQAIAKPHLLPPFSVQLSKEQIFCLHVSLSLSLSHLSSVLFLSTTCKDMCATTTLWCSSELINCFSLSLLVFFFIFLLCLAIWNLALAWCLLFKQKVRALGWLAFYIICRKFEFCRIISEVVALCLQYYEDGNRGSYIAELRFLRFWSWGTLLERAILHLTSNASSSCPISCTSCTFYS